MTKLPYVEHTSRDYEVCGPDADGEIEVENPANDHITCMWFTRDDIMLMLRRLDHVKGGRSDATIIAGALRDAANKIVPACDAGDDVLQQLRAMADAIERGKV